ncbi:MAG: helix-turn-helix domain-containing protein [Acidaminococcaceae bacterium]|nr:helix-turn-helix domain-containing protein [Acidaminococcaceae bacterium]
MAIKNILKQKRIERGLSVKELAVRAGVSPASIYRWERGNVVNMKLEGITSLARELGIPAYLLAGYKQGVEEETPAVCKEEEMAPTIEAVAEELLRHGIDVYKKKGQYEIQNDITSCAITEQELLSYIAEGIELIKYRLDKHIYDTMPLKEKRMGGRNQKAKNVNSDALF